MATRSRIIVEQEDGTFRSIYCHWDGYPDHNGALLVNHYQDQEKCNQLMDLGDLSSLDENIGDEIDFNDDELREENKQCLSYKRDRKEPNTDGKVYQTKRFNTTMGEEYLYLKEIGKDWMVAYAHSQQFSDLKHLVGE